MLRNIYEIGYRELILRSMYGTFGPIFAFIVDRVLAGFLQLKWLLCPAIPVAFDFV